MFIFFGLNWVVRVKIILFVAQILAKKRQWAKLKRVGEINQTIPVMPIWLLFCKTANWNLGKVLWTLQKTLHFPSGVFDFLEDVRFDSSLFLFERCWSGSLRVLSIDERYLNVTQLTRNFASFTTGKNPSQKINLAQFLLADEFELWTDLERSFVV